MPQSSKMAIFTYAILPRELLISIFCRVPVKFIGQLRCVSKSWLTLLSNQDFLKTHLTKYSQESHEKLILLSENSHSLHTITLTDDDNNYDGFLNSLNNQQLPNDPVVEISGSCNGLVLLVNEDNTKVVMNPTTLKFKKIPNSPVALPPRMSFSMHGFGYDHVNDDYKVVMISRYDHDNEYEPDILDMFMDVYSLKSGYWRRIKSSPYDHAVPESASGIYVNGSLHWLASKLEDYSSVIGAFVLSDEEFIEVPAPSSVDKKKFVFNKLGTVGGCLCMLGIPNGNKIDFSIMKEYGVEESWTKYIIDGPPFYDFLKPLCFIRDKEVVLNVDGEKMIVYNLQEEKYRDLKVDGIPDKFESVVTFVESLLSPNFPEVKNDVLECFAY